MESSNKVWRGEMGGLGRSLLDLEVGFTSMTSVSTKVGKVMRRTHPN